MEKITKVGENRSDACPIQKESVCVCDANGGCIADYRNRVSLEWNKWREVIAVICDKKVSVRITHATSA